MGSLFTLHEQGWQENRFLSVLLLSLVAALASGMFISASGEDLKVGSRILENILRHVGSEGLFHLSCVLIKLIYLLVTLTWKFPL